MWTGGKLRRAYSHNRSPGAWVNRFPVFAEPNKAAAIRKGGGNEASELAITALEWLKEQQMPDGGWTFDLRRTRTRATTPGQAVQARRWCHSHGSIAVLGRRPYAEGRQISGRVHKGLTFLASRQGGEHAVRPRSELARTARTHVFARVGIDRLLRSLRDDARQGAAAVCAGVAQLY